MRAILVSLSGLALVLAGVGCSDPANSDDQPPAQCSDNQDNDGDGSIDFPDDIGCTSSEDTSEDSPESAKCQDGRDNDGDGLTDYPSDPGCFAPQADNEMDDCPAGPNCPQCADGQDNDDNGSIDYPNDPGCEAASDDEEFPNNPVACGATLMIQTLPVTGVVEGMLDPTSTSMLPSPCGGGGGAPARAYVLHLQEPKVVEISTDDPSTTADTIIDLRSKMCSDTSSELACSDDIDADNTSSKVTESLAAGSYYIIVSGVDSATTGAFRLQVKLFNGEGTSCSSQGDCGPGLVCRTPLGQSAMQCSRPMCDDGVDDDGMGDGNDWPNDPGCTSKDDNDETDDCPNGPNCPECGDGDDNDNDNQTDYPNDPTCKAKGDASEACVSSEGVQLITGPMTMGDTTGQTDDVKPTCSSTSTSGPDRSYRLDVPALSSLNINLVTTSFWDTASVLYNATCGGTAVACSDPNNMVVGAVPAGTYYYVVDGYFSDDFGTYTINVSGKIQNLASCEGVLAASGALTCGAGYACKGTAGARTCQPALCGDGIDNDSPPDGLIDFPFDPGCDSVADDTEADPTTLPVCSDGIDNDSPADGLVDFPADYGCSSAAGTSEVFCMPETDPTALISSAITMGTTIGKTHNQTPSTCASSSSTAADVVYALSLPVPVDTLVIDTVGTAFDTVVYVKEPLCGTMELACNDDGGGSLTSRVSMAGVAPGNYAIIVDGYSSSTTPGPFTLNVKGTVAPNTRCTSPLFSGASPVLVCPMGTTCSGGANARCQ